MMKRTSYATFLSLLLMLQTLAPAAAQTTPAQQPSRQQTQQPQQTQTQPRPTPTPQDEEGEVVRITSNLVQFDAVVLDKNGRHVTDLKPEDFVVSVEGKRQDITNFSYVSNEARTVTAAAPAPKKGDATAAPPAPLPPAHLRPEQVRRTIALVVDDLGTSFESTYSVRRALKKFVDEQMQPGDLVAIIRTSAGVGALQQFTSDKRLLYAAIERVRWNMAGRAGVSAFAPLQADPLAQAGREAQARQAASGSGDGSSDNNRQNDTSGAGNVRAASAEEFREEIFSVGTLGALNYVVRGLKELPGRKSVILFSDGFRLVNRDDNSFNQRILESLRRLTDLANRASVVIYTIDARGLVAPGLTAADDVSGMTTEEIEQSLRDRSDSLFDTQDGMNYLAQQTGGFFIKNNNDLAGGVRKVIEDQTGYYLIGFRPDGEVFDRARFNKLQIKLTRPGLRLRTRGGFYGFTEEEARPVRRTRIEQLVAALTSPFGSGEVPVRVTSLYSREEGKTPDYLNSLVHIDPSNFKFEEEADGWRKAVFDVLIITFGADGKVVDEINRTETVRARLDGYEQMMRAGLVFSMKVPVKKPGAYQLRVAVRDAGTERVGSASQFVEVPNICKGRLTLSGVVMRRTPSANAPAAAANVSTSDGRQPAEDPHANAAVRRFRQGTEVDFLYFIYNAKLDRATGRPQLTTQFRIFRDGQPVHTGGLVQFDPGPQTDMQHLYAGTRVRFNAALSPGEYVLQVVVNDALAKDPKHRTAVQWIDFEIIK